MDYENFELMRDDIVTKIINSPQQITSNIIFKSDTTPKHDLKPYKSTDFVRKYDIYGHNLTLEKYFQYYPFLQITSTKKIDQNGDKYDEYNISADIFTNSVICSYLITDLYQSTGLPKYGLDGNLITYQAFVNGGVGYKITTNQRLSLYNFVKKQKNLTTMKVYSGSNNFLVNCVNLSILTSTLIQTFTNLKYLKNKLDFKSNRCSIDNWFIIKQPVNIKAYNIHHKFQFMILLGMFDFSEIKYKSPKLRINLYQQDEVNEILNFEDKDNGYYILKPWTSIQINTKTRNNIPLDWDGVLFLVSMMIVPEIYYAIVSNSYLFDLLITKTFHPNEVDRLMSGIKNCVERRIESNYEKALNLATGIRFKIGMIDRIVSYFES